MPELEPMFQMTVTRDELTMITLGLGAAGSLIHGDPQTAMIHMIVTYVNLRQRVGKDFKEPFESVLEKVTKMATHYAENKKPHD